MGSEAGSERADEPGQVTYTLDAERAEWLQRVVKAFDKLRADLEVLEHDSTLTARGRVDRTLLATFAFVEATNLGTVAVESLGSLIFALDELDRGYVHELLKHTRKGGSYTPTAATAYVRPMVFQLVQYWLGQKLTEAEAFRRILEVVGAENKHRLRGDYRAHFSTGAGDSVNLAHQASLALAQAWQPAPAGSPPPTPVRDETEYVGSIANEEQYTRVAEALRRAYDDSPRRGAKG